MIFCYGAVFLWLCRPCLESYLFYDYESYKPMINCVWWVPETIFYVWRQSSRYFEENLLLTVSSNCMLSSLGMLRVLPEYLSLHHQLTEEIFGWDKDDDQWGEGCAVVAWGLQHWYIFLLTRKYSEIFDSFTQNDTKMVVL